MECLTGWRMGERGQLLECITSCRVENGQKGGAAARVPHIHKLPGGALGKRGGAAGVHH